MRPATLLAVAICLFAPTVANAHVQRAEPGTWWRSWNIDPLVLSGLAMLAWCYCRGLRRLWARSGTGTKVRRWQIVAYFSALGAILVALVSPVDALSEELSSLHMVQHMILINLAAPLTVLGSPLLVLAWGTPEISTTRIGGLRRNLLRTASSRLLWQPLTVWTLFAVTLYIWHHPLLYQAALRDPLLHDVQHLSFFTAACLFWRPVLDPLSTRRMSALLAVPYLFATSLHSSGLGIFLTLSTRVWYGHYTTTATAWGITPLEDQQLAGLIMWMPSCLIYPALAAIVFGIWLAQPGR